jgi:hypothetical protein
MKRTVKASQFHVTPIWIISGGLLFLWFTLKFIFHKGGYVHIFLIAAITVLGIQLLAHRNMRYHQKSSGSTDAV